jgi:S-layer homology domain
MKYIRFKLMVCIFFILFTGVFAVISSWADPLDNWTQRTSGTNSNLNGITYGNDMFVAVGNSGTILTSTNGTNWTARSSGTGATLSDVTYGNGTFVAVGVGARFVTSTNGINWTYIHPYSENLPTYSITYGNGLFVAVGYWDLVYTSPDGFNWTKRSSGVNYNLYCIAYGNGRFVAGGEDGKGVTSTDGINWSPMSLGFTSWSFADILYAEGIFLSPVTGSPTYNIGTIAYSSDGINWNYKAPPSDVYYLTGVAYGNNTFVIVTDNYPNSIITSPDCCNWTARSPWMSGKSVAYGANTFVSVNNLGFIFQSDPVTETNLFQDVPSGHWAETAIYKIYNAGITKGCSENPLKYCPENPVTRTQMAVFLGRGKHGSGFTPPSATGIFADVPVSYWAADWIEQFYNDGITTGCGTNPLRYCPGNNVTRAQMAIFLLRSKHGSSYTPPAATGIFADVPVSYWAAAWIEQLYHEGITTGCSTGPLRYCPENSVTRAQMAVFIMRTFGL